MKNQAAEGVRRSKAVLVCSKALNVVPRPLLCSFF
jgi:hypothetical protein